MIKKIIKKDFFSPFIWPKTLKIIRKFCFKKNLRYFGMFFLKKRCIDFTKKVCKISKEFGVYFKNIKNLFLARKIYYSLII